MPLSTLADFTAIKCITRYIGNYYQYELTNILSEAMRDSLSRGQLMSKLSAVQLVSPYASKVTNSFFIGHWHGLLPMLFYEYGVIVAGRGIEIDPFWVTFSNQLNHYWDWNSETGDADKFIIPDTDLVINTSCEHMSNEWLGHVKSGTLVCAQSTDYSHPTHINRVDSLEQFMDFWNGYTILDSSSKRYDVYSRFTVIARKN